jgi:DNA polymerase-3 subunit delta'
MDGDSHPDFLWISSDGAFIKIDQIRAIRARLRFRPFEGKWRVVVIRDAHRLREEAANALLKILEEPPGRNLFILLALEPQMLLPTIVSRCCHVRFQPLDNQIVEHYLTGSRGMSEAMAREAARLAEGSLERAAWWAESDRLSRWREVLERVRKLKGLNMFDFFTLTEKWSKTSEDLEQDFECIKIWLRDLIISLLTEGARDGGGGAGDLARDMVPEGAAVMDLFLLYDRVEAAMRHMRQNANKQLTLEGVCLAIKGKLYGEGNWNPFSGGW